MSEYRAEIRIFGLLGVAFLATLLLAGGLLATGVTGQVLGISFKVAGPAAFFPILVLIFRVTGLFKVHLEDVTADALTRQVEKLSLQEVQGQLKEINDRSSWLDRRRQELQKAIDALEQQATGDSVMTVAGITRARRGG